MPAATCAPFFDRFGFVVSLLGRRRRQRGEIGAEIADVFVAEPLDDRLHLLILARAGAEVDEPPLDELVELAGQRGHVLHLRDAVLAVAADAEFGLLLAGLDVGGVGRG